MSKAKSSKAPKTQSKGRWGSSNGWKVLDIKDELLLGAEEGGFAGLEVLEDVSLIDAGYLASLNQAAAQQPDAAEGPASKGKTAKALKRQQQEVQPAAASTKKRKMSAAAAARSGSEPVGDADDVHTLKARLAALEAENRALKKQKRNEKEGHPSQHTMPQAAADQGLACAEVAGTAPEGVRPSLQSQGLSRKQRKLKQNKQKAEQRKQLRLEKAKQAKQAKQLQKTAKAAELKANDSSEQQQQQHIDMTAWARFNLHPDLQAALAALGFSSPTPIQDAVLLPAIRDRRDIIGAAETGSGKTLAFGLPILQVMRRSCGAAIVSGTKGGDTAGSHGAAGVGSGAAQQRKAGGSSLRALILAPTRELALQVCQHLQALGRQVGVRVIALVGGIAPVKQDRLLRQKPPVVVATPGRLWDLMRQGQQHLCDLSRLSFFGHYQELTHILGMLPTAERAAAAAAAASAEAQERRLQQQKASEQRQKQQTKDPTDEEGEESEEEFKGGDQDGDEDEQQRDQTQQQQQQHRPTKRGTRTLQEPSDAAEGDESEIEHGAAAMAAGAATSHKQLLQTFVFSATLTLPAQLHKRLRRGGGGSSGAASLESLMDRLCFRQRPAVVDLAPSTRLAGRVNEGLVRCLDEERDACLYYLLARHPGKAL
eukprot:gene1872-2209_t